MKWFVLFTSVIAILQLRTPVCYAANVTDVRLVDQGGNIVSQSGLVQIELDGDGRWGAICDDGFGDNDAFVVCRMLGFTNGGKASYQLRFPTGAEQIFLLDDTNCAGDELTLTECITAQTTDCSVGGDSIVSVQCNNNAGPGEPTNNPRTTTTETPEVIIDQCIQTGTNPNPNVRLYPESNTGRGFVEVRNPNNGQWGFVCDDFWDSTAALVVCRELCYDTAAYTPKPGIPSEEVTYPTNPNIIRDDVVCTGNEQSLLDCPALAWGVENCQGRELAGVSCLPAESQPPDPPVPILVCREGRMLAQFSRVRDDKLEEKHLVVYQNGVACPDVTKTTTDNFVSIEIPVNRCGTTNTQSNSSHIVYKNTVTYLPTEVEGAITRRNTYQVGITCSLPTGLRVTQRVQPLTESVTQKAQGVFVMQMEIYRNDSFEEAVQASPVRIPLGEWLNMAVSMERDDPNLKIVLIDCMTTPTGDLSQQPVQKLIENKCPIEKTVSIYPLSNFQMGFRFKPFKFGGHDLMYVICDSLVCRRNDVSRLCDRSCDNEKPEINKRKKRSIYDKFFEIVKSPQIVFYDPKKYNETIDNVSENENDNFGVEVVPRVTNPPTAQENQREEADKNEDGQQIAAPLLPSIANAGDTNLDQSLSESPSVAESELPSAVNSESDLTFGSESDAESPVRENVDTKSESGNGILNDPDSDTDIDSQNRPTPPSLRRVGNSGPKLLSYNLLFVQLLISYIFIMVYNL